MRRGTTPQLTFTLPFELVDIDKIYITFNQGATTKIEKDEDDITYSDKTITLELTQAETLSLDDGLVSIQIRIKFTDGTAIASDIISTSAKEILKEGAI